MFGTVVNVLDYLFAFISENLNLSLVSSSYLSAAIYLAIISSCSLFENAAIKLPVKPSLRFF
jgi:hypothetical protein